MAADLVRQEVKAPVGIFGRPAAPAAPPGIEQVVKQFVTSLTSRVKLVEERVENIRDRIELVEHSLIDKHKTSIKQIKELHDEMRVLRGDVEETKTLIERVVKRLDAFASGEEVKVLRRYVELWQPMSYVNRAEAKAIVRNILKEEGLIKEIKEED